MSSFIELLTKGTEAELARQAYIRDIWTFLLRRDKPEEERVAELTKATKKMTDFWKSIE